MWSDIFIAFMIAFLVSYVVTPYTVRLAKKVGALDNPKTSSRKIHKKITPRLGGIAIIAGLIASTTYLFVTMSIEKKINLFDDEKYIYKMVSIFLGTIVLGIFCFFDDTKGIKPYIKLLGQMLATIIIIKSGIKIENIKVLENLKYQQIILNLITFIWIIGITNAINLTDGLDGLAAGVCLIACLSLLIIFIINGSTIFSIILIIALAGAIVGFMPYNMNPARTFLGDTGSNFLGFMIAIISIMGSAKTYTATTIIAPLLVLALPVFDTSFAIIRRIFKEKSLKAVFKADRGHLHHKLIDKGYTQKQAVFILYGISATFGLFATIWIDSGIWKALSFALIAGAIIAIGYKDIFRVKNKTTYEGENK